MPSAEQGSCEYHFLTSFGMTRLGEMNLRTLPLQHRTGSVHIVSTVDLNPTFALFQSDRYVTKSA